MQTVAESSEHAAALPSAVVLERARAIAREYYSSCLWFRHPDATIETLEDVRLIIRHLRENGDRKAWLAAQELHKCL